MILLNSLNHAIIALVEVVFAPFQLSFVFWKEPVYLLHGLVVHLEELIRLVLYVKFADRANPQRIHICVVVLLESCYDILFARS